MTELYQIYYHESQKESLFPFAIPYYNPGLTVFFENDCIKTLVQATKADKIGVCSWKLSQKLRHYIGKHRELTKEVLESEYDVLSFTKNTDHHQMLASADKHHPGFRAIMTDILHHASIKMPHEVKMPIYQNHYCAKSEIYKAYVKDYLVPCMWLMENEPGIKAAVMKDANYSKLAKKDAVDPEYLREKIGVPFYPLAPFLLERLFSIYCFNNKIRVTHL